MSDIKQELDRIRDRISDPSFLANKGLSNEVGIHVFCYDPADELIVRDFVSRLKAESGTPYHIKECDLYEIFLRLLEDKRVLRSVDGLEEKRGKEYLLKQLQKIATPEALLEYMKYEPHEYGDVLFLTGVGKIFPFMRSHKMLDSMQHPDREWALDGLAVRCDHTDLVAALGDIDTDNEHNTHLNIDLQTVLMVL